MKLKSKQERQMTEEEKKILEDYNSYHDLDTDREKCEIFYEEYVDDLTGFDEWYSRLLESKERAIRRYEKLQAQSINKGKK